MEKKAEVFAATQIRQQQYNQEIDLEELFFAILHEWQLLILAAAIGGCLMASYHTFFVKNTYEATTTMYITNTDSVISFQDLQIGSALTEDYKTIITSRTVLNKVIENLELNVDYQKLRELITVTNPTGTHIINTSVVTTDINTSRNIANDLLLVSVEQIYQIVGTGRPTVIDYSEVEAVEDVTPSIYKFIAIGCMIGIALVVTITTMKVMMDNTIKNDEDVEKYLRLPVLSAVPYFEE